MAVAATPQEKQRDYIVKICSRNINPLWQGGGICKHHCQAWISILFPLARFERSLPYEDPATQLRATPG
jgi:hypothetical protein